MSFHLPLLFCIMYFTITFCNNYYPFHFVAFYKEDKCKGTSHFWENVTNDEPVLVPTDSWMYNKTRSILYFGKWSALVGFIFENTTEENAYYGIYNYTIEFDKDVPYCEDFGYSILNNEIIVFLSIQGNLSEELPNFGYEMFLYSTLSYPSQIEEPIDLVFVNSTGLEIIPPRYFKRFVLFYTSVWTLYEENGFIENYQCMRYNSTAESNGLFRVTYIETNARLKVGSINVGCVRDATTIRPPAPISNFQYPSANPFLTSSSITCYYYLLYYYFVH